MRGKNFFLSKNRGGSQFWQGLHTVKEWFERGKGNIVQDGKHTRLWKDVWLDECHLMIQFPNLFKTCHDQDILVNVVANNQWNTNYRRRFGVTELGEWTELMEKLEGVVLTDQSEKVIWKLEKSGKYTARSLYRLITFGGVRDVKMMEVWTAKIPLKVKIFIWMAWHNRIQTAEQLKRRNWDGSKEHEFCGIGECVDHLLFRCPIAVVTWCWVRDSLGWAMTSIERFQDLFFESWQG